MRGMVVVAGLACVLCGTASAALDTSNVYTDAWGPWTGTVIMSQKAGGIMLDAEIQWCVDIPIVHDGEDQFRYNYQITSRGNDPLTLLAVSMLSNNRAVDIGWTSLETGDVAPTAAYFHGDPDDYDSANWTFPGGLVGGKVSDELFFWSVSAPTSEIDWSVIQGRLFAGAPLPSPSPSASSTGTIPEPATMGTLALGIVALVRRCLRRRRSGRGGSGPGTPEVHGV